MIGKNCFVTHGHDKDGRPIVWLQIAKFGVQDITPQLALHFMCYLLDHTLSVMKSNVDQMIMIYEMENAGYANFSFELGKIIIEASSELFVSTVFRIYVTNANFIVNCCYSALKPFLL